ncbi:DUF3899 domain-containing protein [Listeria ilorinensis]|uniref:DUF3899 domain-containing protein n=1 Tax=Listeria ilorinensis TaxID=2867439 RepID=UPI001EF5453B|nr:DUF3899 domain-containing protein [Listeria ilorinensis]
MLIQEGQFSLFHYINISFGISFFFFLAGLLIYIMKSGFLDRTHDSFRKFLRRKDEEETEFSDMMLSELVGIGYQAILFSALFVLATCLIALLFYYL